MHEAAEHHMRHPVDLAPQRGLDMGMVVAVAGRPPAGDAVDQFAPVGEADERTLRRNRLQRLAGGLHLGIRQPDVFEQVFRGHGLAHHYFVTSTGTGVGKTYVTAALIRQARAQGLTVAATKPLISGFDKSEIATSDTGVILAALGEAPTLEAAEKSRRGGSKRRWRPAWRRGRKAAASIARRFSPMARQFLKGGPI